MRKSRIVLIASVMIAIFALTGCAKLKDVRPTSCKIENISPQGFRKIGMKIALGVNNPSVQFTINQASATLNSPKGQVAVVEAMPFTIMRKSQQVYPVDVEVKFAKGFGLQAAMQLLKNPKEAKAYTVNIQAKVKLKGGAQKNILFEDIPLEKFMKMIKL